MGRFIAFSLALLCWVLAYLGWYAAGLNNCSKNAWETLTSNDSDVLVIIFFIFCGLIFCLAGAFVKYEKNGSSQHQ